MVNHCVRADSVFKDVTDYRLWFLIVYPSILLSHGFVYLPLPSRAGISRYKVSSVGGHIHVMRCKIRTLIVFEKKIKMHTLTISLILHGFVIVKFH